MGFDVTAVVPLLQFCCGFFIFGYRVSFLIGSSLLFLLFNGCSAVSCYFGVSLRRGFPDSSVGKESACKETPVRFLGREDPLEKGKATHSSFLAWRIPWTV